MPNETKIENPKTPAEAGAVEVVLVKTPTKAPIQGAWAKEEARRQAILAAAKPAVSGAVTAEAPPEPQAIEIMHHRTPKGDN